MKKTALSVLRRILPILLTVLLISGCLPASRAKKTLSVTLDALEDPEFGAVSIGCTPDEFQQMGFQPGDSCDVSLSNGFRLEDVPVYTGYYCLTGMPLIVLYPGYAHPGLTLCNVGDLWKTSGAKQGDTVTVTLKEAGKYANVQEALSAVYSNNRADYATDTAFCNFRELSGGKLRRGMFYRGTSPVDDRNLRAAATDALIREAGIGFILDLADTEQKATAYPDFPGSYFAELYADGQTACLGLKSAFRSPEYAASLAEGLRRMMEQEQPVYIHCTEGKDRTGFVCILLEALAGASCGEICGDYMASFENYYGISAEGTPEKYAVTEEVYFRDILNWFAGVPEGTDLSGQTFEEAAREYLRFAGLTEAEIGALTLYLTGEA